MAADPFQVVRDFEQALCEYTGAPYAVTVNSCTMALLLAVAYHIPRMGREFDSFSEPLPPMIEIPKRTYVSVPMSIIHAGGRPVFRDEEWLGAYQLKPLLVWDSARWLTSGLYRHPLTGDNTAGRMLCLSFHASKTLGDTQGGAILHDDPAADKWLRRARFDGRTEGVAPRDDTFDMIGWHCYLSPDVAARLLWRLSRLPLHNEPLPNDDYPELDKMECFQ